MRDHSIQQPTDGLSDLIPELPTFPPPVAWDRQREALRSRKRRRIGLALLLTVGLLVWAAWASQPSDRENLNLPHVTVEVQGMS